MNGPLVLDTDLYIRRGIVKLQAQANQTRRRHLNNLQKYGIESASAQSLQGWQPEREDYFAEETQRKLFELIAKSFDLHINNADIRGNNLGRTARCIGAGIDWKTVLLSDEIGLTPAETTAVAARLNRIRTLHSTSGDMDASGRGRSEGIQQVIAFLTHLIMGGCLIHRVTVNEPGRLLPLAIELIPGSRVSTPFSLLGDPLVHNGIRYADQWRSRAEGWYVKRVPRTIGNTTAQIPEWDFVPECDGSFLELIETAGMDRALPSCVSVMRLVFNRGQMFENCVEAARNHSSIHAVVQVAEGTMFDRAADAADETTQTATLPQNWRNVDGVKERYINEHDKVEFRTAVTPAPDFVGFNDVADERMSRGLNTRKSEFTRKSDNSYSGGMQERQNDNPNVDQMRENFIDKWNKVHGWFLDACCLSGLVEMPGYCAETQVFWMQARKQPPAEIPLNPVDHRNAQKLALAMGQTDEFAEAEADGKDYEHIIRNRATAMALRRAVEIEFKLTEHALDPMQDLPEVEKTTTVDRDGDGLPDEKNRKRDGLTSNRARPSARFVHRMEAAV